ncbi:hypothetical protein ACJ7V3_18285 [Halomonas elongata]|uniref:hypothetical protein n=1 Tax=Halomonas elongata TaxID=2746 RepID=UPI0038D4D342
MSSLKQRSSWTALAASTALLLSACGNNYPDTAQITPNDSRLASMVDSSRPMELLYLTDEDIRDAERLSSFRSDVKTYLRNDESTPYQDHIDFSLAGDNQGIEDLKEALAAFDNQRQNTDEAWDTHLEDKLSPLQSQMETAQATLTEATEKRDGFQEVIQEAQNKVESIEADIEAKKQRMAELAQQIASKWDQYILDNDLAVRTLGDNTRRVFSYRAFEREECQEDRIDDRLLVDRVDEDGHCYFLWLPDIALKNQEASGDYAKNFHEYIQLTREIGKSYSPDEGTLEAKLDQAEDKLDEAEIRAENRYGRQRQVKYQHQRAARDVEQLQRKIDNIQSTSAKERFLGEYTQQARNEVKTVLNDYVSRQARELLSSVQRTEVALSTAFPLEKEADVLLVNIPTASFLQGKGHLITTIDMTKPVDSERLTITPTEQNSMHFTSGDANVQIVMTAAAATPLAADS